MLKVRIISKVLIYLHKTSLQMKDDNKLENRKVEPAQKIVHLQIGDKNYYYGSIAAMVVDKGEAVLGLSLRKMKDMRISALPYYETPTGAIIRISKLKVIRKERTTKQPTDA